MSTEANSSASTIPESFAVTVNSNPLPDSERTEILKDPGFGERFSDHMVYIPWSQEQGWHDPAVLPYGPITLEPASAVLHYGQEVFEGIKGYRHADGSIWTFRPEENARRLQRSAKRLALPELPEDLFLQSLHELIALDGAWVPSGEDQSLYLRPFIFANESFLGVRPAREVSYYLISSPSGAYFKGEGKPVSIWLSKDYARAGKGGTGAAKTGGNYAASLLPQSEAYANGCDQVVFLDQDGFVEELGGMNIVFLYRDGTLVTPASDSILEGITRQSILQLAKDRGLKVEEKPVSFKQWRDDVASGEIVEVFACGTAAVVTQIGLLKGADFEDVQPTGDLALSLREELTDIQYGRREDKHGWLRRLDV